MIENIMKAVKSGNKKRGRNITIGAVIGLLLSCVAVMGEDIGHEIVSKNDSEYDFINNEDIAVSSSGEDVIGLAVISSTMRNILNNKSINAAGDNSGGIFINSSTVEGDIINNGAIDTTGTSKSYGIIIGDSSIMRDIINNGTISVVGTDEAHGINIDSYAEVRDIVNNGAINVISNDGKSVGILGLYATVKNILNSGRITGTVSSGGNGYGINLEGAEVEEIINTGNITGAGYIFGGYGYGINLLSGSTIKRYITNSGSITGTAVGGSGGFSRGISLDDAKVEEIINSGRITGAGADNGYGIYLLNGSTIEGDITNSGSIIGISNAYGNGVRLSNSTIEGDITNSGSITGTTTGSSTSGYGINLSDAKVEEIINSGNITGTSTGDSSSGNGVMLSSSLAAINIINGGSITGTVTNNPGSGHGIFNDGAIETLINSGLITGTGENNGKGVSLGSSTTEGDITNSGSITAAGSSSSGISLNWATIKGDITNSGSITSTGTSSVYGMYLIGPAINIINSGVISGRAPAGAAGYGIESRSYGNKGNINNLGVVFGSISAVGENSTVNNYGILIAGRNSVVEGGTATNYGLEISGTDGKVSEAAQNLTDPIVIGHDAEGNEIKREMNIKNAGIIGSSGVGTSTDSFTFASNPVEFDNSILNGKDSTLKVSGADNKVSGSIINAYGRAVIFDTAGGEITLSGTVVNGGIDGSSTVIGSDTGDVLILQSAEIKYVDGNRVHNTVINGNIDMGKGEDIFTIAGEGIVNGNIDMGMGDDTLTVGIGSTINGKIDMGEGKDVLTIADKGIINGNINMGIGEDSLTIETGSIINGKIDMGEGKDVLTIADEGIVNGDIDMGAEEDTLTVGIGSIINGKIDMGEGEDTLTIETGSIINGTLDGGVGNDTLNFNSPVTRASNSGEINILHNISDFENMNINTNVTLFETTVKNDGSITDLTVTGAGNITIGENGVLTLRIDSANGNKHALSTGNTGTIKSENGGKLLLALNGAGNTSTISFGNLALDGSLVTEYEGKYQEDVTFATTSVLHSVEKTGGTNEIKVAAKVNLPTRSTAPDDLAYEKLNKIYHSLCSPLVDGLGNFNVDDEKLSTFLGYLNDIYAGNPYSYSSELSRKSSGMFRDIVTENQYKPNLNKWMIYGGLTHVDGGTKDTYYGKGYYTYDIGSSDMDADTKITGAYILGEYGVSDTLTSGVVIGGNRLKSDLSNGSKVDGDALYVGGYVKKYVGNLKVTGGAGFQYGDYDADRLAVNNAASSTGTPVMKYSDNYNDMTYDIYLNGRYSHNIGDNLFLEPYGTLSYTYIKQDGADEGNKTLAIETDSKSFDYTVGKVGIDLKKNISHLTGKSTLSAGVSYTKILDGADEEHITGRFKGGSDFDILVAHKNEHSIGLNAKYALELENGILFDVKGTYSVERDSNNNSRKNKTKGEWIVGTGVGYKF